MTSLSERKSRLVVEFSDAVRERGRLRPVTMELKPWGASVRLKGMRQSYEVSAAAIYGLAVKQFVAEQRDAKKARKGK